MHRISTEWNKKHRQRPISSYKSGKLRQMTNYWFVALKRTCGYNCLLSVRAVCCDSEVEKNITKTLSLLPPPFSNLKQTAALQFAALKSHLNIKELVVASAEHHWLTHSLGHLLSATCCSLSALTLSLTHVQTHSEQRGLHLPVQIEAIRQTCVCVNRQATINVTRCARMQSASPRSISQKLGTTSVRQLVCFAATSRADIFDCVTWCKPAGDSISKLPLHIDKAAAQLSYQAAEPKLSIVFLISCTFMSFI